MEFAGILITLFYILVAAKLGGELFQRIKQPAVLGELVAGVIIGTSALGLVHESDIFTILA
jgi:Kef-type K+ transport system membrane component KefB